MWSAAARDAAEGRTVFSAKPPAAGTRVGERLSELPLTLRSDPRAPGLECAPFVVAHASGDDASVFDNGLPLARHRLGARRACSNRLVTTRHSAALTGLPVAPGDRQPAAGRRAVRRSLDEMVAATGHAGLLLTCLWYIREVDPATLLLTGLTRDGVYLVESGEVVGEVNNFRFNESPVDLLSPGHRGRAHGADAAARVERLLHAGRDAGAADAGLQHEFGQPGRMSAGSPAGAPGPAGRSPAGGRIDCPLVLPLWEHRSIRNAMTRLGESVARATTLLSTDLSADATVQELLRETGAGAIST